MKKYKTQICLIAAVFLLGTAAFCSYHIYDHYADEAEQTEAFENIAEIVEQAQAEERPRSSLDGGRKYPYGIRRTVFEKHGYGRLAFHSRHDPQLSRDADTE